MKEAMEGCMTSMWHHHKMGKWPVCLYAYITQKRVQFTNDYVYVLCRNKIHLQIIKSNTLSWNQHMTFTGP